MALFDKLYQCSFPVSGILHLSWKTFRASLPEHMEFVYHLTLFSGILAVHGILDGRGRLSEDRVRIWVPFHHLTLCLKPERCFLWRILTKASIDKTLQTPFCLWPWWRPSTWGWWACRPRRSRRRCRWSSRSSPACGTPGTPPSSPPLARATGPVGETMKYGLSDLFSIKVIPSQDHPCPRFQAHKKSCKKQ